MKKESRNLWSWKKSTQEMINQRIVHFVVVPLEVINLLKLLILLLSSIHIIHNANKSWWISNKI